MTLLPSPPKPPETVRLYHFPTSLGSQAVRIAFEEKGIAWESRIVNIGPALEQFEPWYARLNPRMVVPTLELVPGAGLPSEIVTDTRRILEAVDHRFPGPALAPSDPVAHAEMQRWLERHDALELRELTYARTPGLTGWLLRRSLKTRLRRLVKLRAAHDELAADYEAKIADLDRWRTTVADPRRVAEIERRIADDLDRLESALADRPYLAGADYSLADIAWTVVLGRLDHLRLSWMWQDGKRPALAEYYQRMRARSSSLHATNNLGTVQKLRLVARVVLPKLIMAWLIKIALFWLGARILELLAA